MVPPLYDALHKVHDLLGKTTASLRRLKQTKLRAIENFKKRGGTDWKKSKYNFVIDSCMTTIHIVGGTLDKCISFRQKIDQVNESMEAYIIQWQSETIAEVSLSRNPFKLFSCSMVLAFTYVL